jgi:hypothetical protein
MTVSMMIVVTISRKHTGVIEQSCAFLFTQLSKTISKSIFIVAIITLL